jgi:predicted small lipoprotein YifL
MFYRSPMILGAKRTALTLAWILGCLAAALLAGCGQKGPLYIPKDDPAAAQRATLPQALLNTVRTPQTPQPPASSASAPDAAASSPSPAQPVTP